MSAVAKLPPVPHQNEVVQRLSDGSTTYSLLYATSLVGALSVRSFGEKVEVGSTPEDKGLYHLVTTSAFSEAGEVVQTETEALPPVGEP